MAQNEQDTVKLLDEEGKEHNFIVLDIITVNDNDYAILLPTEEGFIDSESGEQEAVIFRIVETEDEQTLMAVEDDEEWEAVARAWEEVNMDEEYDDLEDEEDDTDI